MLSMSTTFAENENVSNVNATAAYDMTVNYKKLAEALDLTSDQIEGVQDVHNTFCNEMMLAATANKDERQAIVDRVVKWDLLNMSYILNDKQMRTYRMLLNITLVNRGLNK